MLLKVKMARQKEHYSRSYITPFLLAVIAIAIIVGVVVISNKNNQQDSSTTLQAVVDHVPVIEVSPSLGKYETKINRVWLGILYAVLVLFLIRIAMDIRVYRIKLMQDRYLKKDYEYSILQHLVGYDGEEFILAHYNYIKDVIKDTLRFRK